MLYIYGAGGHAMVVADVARLCGWTVAGFIDDVAPTPRPFCGALMLGGRDTIPAGASVFIAVGNNAARLKIASELAAAFPVLIHPSAIVAASTQIGTGTIIMAGAVVQPGTRIGAHCIVNTRASVDHECVLDDGVHLSPAVALGGGCHIGHATWLGIGCVVRDHTTIGTSCTIGAGAVVVKDIPSGVLAYGVPAVIH